MNNWTFDELDRIIDGLRFMAKYEAKDQQAKEGLMYWAGQAVAIKRSLEWERDHQAEAKPSVTAQEGQVA